MAGMNGAGTMPARRAAWASPMKRFIKRLGTGKHLTKDLPPEDAGEAMRLILSGEATDAQVGAFFAALRVKEESVEELVAFTQAARAVAGRLHAPSGPLLDVAEAYDGRERTMPVAPLAAFIVAGAGLPILLHGSTDIPAKYGVTSGEVFAHLGIPTEGDPAQAAARLAASGIAYLHTSRFCPALERLKPIRQELGLRTALNTIEKLLDPGRATCHLVGAFHGPALETLPEVMRRLGHVCGAVVQGTEASCDLSLSRPTRLIRFSADGVEAIKVAPESLGVVSGPDVALPEGGAAGCAGAVRTVLSGGSHPLRVAALLTAGAWLWLAGCADSPRAGLAMALESLESGEAYARLLASRRNPPRVAAGPRAQNAFQWPAGPIHSAEGGHPVPESVCGNLIRER